MLKKTFSHFINGAMFIPLIWFTVVFTTPAAHLLQTSQQNVLVNTIEVV